MKAEFNPDRWFRIEVQIEMDNLRKKLSKYVNCDPDDLVILENASAGINSILKSLKFQSNETILYYNIAYGMVKLTLQYVSSEIFTQEQIIQVDLDHQTIQNTDLLLKKTQDTLNRIPNVKLIVFDHISSVPAVLFDIEKMIKYFRTKGILTLVDGAHAIGAIELDLNKIDPDFYLTNTHKWLYTHRSSCLLYVKKDLQKLIHPIITSFGYLQSFQSEFFWLGTKDYSSYLTISDALDFRQTIASETEIFSYNHQLAIQAGNLLAQMWNSSILISDEKYISTMNNIELPLMIDTLDKMNTLYQKLINEHNIFLPMFQFDDKFYCRISAQIYMELNDYQTVGNIVLNKISNIKVLPIVKQKQDNFRFV
jgi:selenocysteine lyase/cysteine desulfurase